MYFLQQDPNTSAVDVGDAPIDLPFVSQLPYGDLLTQLILFFAAFLVVYLAGRIILVPITRQGLRSREVDAHARKPLLRLLKLGIVFVAVAVAFGAAGFGSFLTSLATIAAAATLAIGFAMQDIIKNFVSGVFIYTDKPFRIGDWIEWGDYSGEVEDISLRVTRVRTFDNELLTVPNSDLTNGVVKNPVDGDKLRLKILFGIGYSDSIGEAMEIILEEARKHEGIMDEPEPSVRLTTLEDSYVGLQARIWIKNPSRSDFVRIRSEYVQNVKQRLDEEGIEIPFPQLTLSGGIEVSGAVPAEATE